MDCRRGPRRAPSGGLNVIAEAPLTATRQLRALRGLDTTWTAVAPVVLPGLESLQPGVVASSRVLQTLEGGAPHQGGRGSRAALAAAAQGLAARPRALRPACPAWRACSRTRGSLRRTPAHAHQRVWMLPSLWLCVGGRDGGAWWMTRSRPAELAEALQPGRSGCPKNADACQGRARMPPWYGQLLAWM